MKFAINQAVKVVVGKYVDLAGIVNRRYEDENGVQYEISICGVKDNKPVMHTGAFVENSLETLK